MQNHFHIDFGTKLGTAGGALTTLFYNFHSADIMKTLILGTIGATVSFFVSLFLKWFTNFLKNKFRRSG